MSRLAGYFKTIKCISLVCLSSLVLNACSGADISHNLDNVKESLYSMGSIFSSTKTKNVNTKNKKPQKVVDSSLSDENALLACPRIEYIEELSIVDKYKDNHNPHYDGLEYTANIAHFESSCRILPDKQQADIEVYIRFYGEIGAAGRLKPKDKVSISHPYFIATLDKDNNIINKQVETLSFDYDGHEKNMVKMEKIKYVMPYDETHNPKDYRVVIGFILTKAQIENNRRDYQF